MLRALLAVAWLLVTPAAGAQGPPTGPAAGAPAAALDPVLERRELAIAAELRCLVCQNQSIAESNADLARDLRAQIRTQLLAGRSDAEIRDFMTARYGDFVLYRPPLRGTTLLLWFGPFALLALGAFIGWRIVRARRAAGVSLSETERARAAALLGAGPKDSA